MNVALMINVRNIFFFKDIFFLLICYRPVITMLKGVQIHLMALAIHFRICFYALLKCQTFHNVSETPLVMENRQLSLKEKNTSEFLKSLT